MTMTMYNVAGTPAAPTAGSEIASVTQNIRIPYRPSASPACTDDPSRWLDDNGECQTGVAAVVDFVFPAGIAVPDTLIWAVSFNTRLGGYDPTDVNGPYDYLNVGAWSRTPQPAVGIDVDEDVVFISWRFTDDEFVTEADWTGFRPMARIETHVPPPEPPVTTAAPPSSTPETSAPISPGSPGAATTPLTGAPLSIAG